MQHIFKGILLFTALFFSTAYAALPTHVINQSMPTLAPMLKEIMPGVVNIAAIRTQAQPEENDTPSSGDEPLPRTRRKLGSMGSGVVVDTANGYILTNAHVVYKAENIQIQLSDGRMTDARVIGLDQGSDIAVLQIKENHLTTIPLGNSDDLQVGDFVVAIGNPFGLTQSVSSGIVSALQRSDLHIVGRQGYENFIQTDAPINPGNSGGALVNLKGELIGINTAILATDGSNLGIGFAIPINMAVSVMQQLIDHGNVSRGLLGVLSQSVTPDLKNALHLNKDQGAIVTFVTRYSPADKAGLQIGDVITKINDKTVKDSFQLRNLIGLLQINDKVHIEYVRHGKKYSSHITIADPKTQESENRLNDPFFYGVTMKNFDIKLPTLERTQGVLVLDMDEHSAAAKARLRRGDVILSINQKNTTSLEELQNMVQGFKGQQLILRVLRVGEIVFVVLERKE